MSPIVSIATVCTAMLLTLAMGIAKTQSAAVQGHHRYVVDRSISHLKLSADWIWTQLLASHPAPETAIVVEVGVFNGQQCAEAAGYGFGQVVCFEPSPTSFKNSQEHLDKARTPKWRNVKLLQLAAGPTSNQTLEFHALGSTSDHAGVRSEVETQFIGHTISVASVALDDYFKSARVYLMKIDTQGFDGMVLKGMLSMLYEKRVQYILMEIWPKCMRRALSCEETLKLAINAGYRVHELTVNALNAEGPKPADWFSHPAPVDAFCQWFLNFPSKFGVWTDVLMSHY